MIGKDTDIDLGTPQSSCIHTYHTRVNMLSHTHIRKRSNEKLNFFRKLLSLSHKKLLPVFIQKALIKSIISSIFGSRK